MNARLLSQFILLNIPTPTDGSLHAIYSRVMHSILDEFAPSQFNHHSEFIEVVLCRRLFVFILLLFCASVSARHIYFFNDFTTLLSVCFCGVLGSQQ